MALLQTLLCYPERKAHDRDKSPCVLVLQFKEKYRISTVITCVQPYTLKDKLSSNYNRVSLNVHPKEEKKSVRTTILIVQPHKTQHS